MKRRQQREMLERIDTLIDEAIRNGVTSNKKQKRILEEEFQRWVFDDSRPFSIKSLIKMCAGFAWSSSKQRLRHGGKIEITKRNAAILVEDLEQTDIEFIDGRRMSHIVGELINRAVFNYRHGRRDICDDTVQVIAQIEKSEPEMVQERIEEIVKAGA